MIYLTEAHNDDELAPHLGDLAIRAPIPHGDVIWTGKWWEGAEIRVCGERKKLGDLADCILRTGRYLHQLQQAQQAGFDHIHLWLEGIMRPGVGGLVEIPRGGRRWVSMVPNIEYNRMQAYLTELSLFAGVQVHRTMSVAETGKQMVNLYLWYQKQPEDHKSLQQWYRPNNPSNPNGNVLRMQTPSAIRRVVHEAVRGIGWDISLSVESRFKSIAEMVNATEADWREIPGIGKVLAQRAWSSFHDVRVE